MHLIDAAPIVANTHNSRCTGAETGPQGRGHGLGAVGQEPCGQVGGDGTTGSLMG